MSRSETKMRKSQRLEKNAELKKNGRTPNQIRRINAKNESKRKRREKEMSWYIKIITIL